MAAVPAAVRARIGKLLDFSKQKDSLGSYLDWWLEYVIKPNRARKTHQEYELACRLYVKPLIGNVLLGNLSPIHTTQWMADMKHVHKFSNHQRRRALRILRAALNRGIKLKMIDENPCDVLDMPEVKKRHVEPLEPEQCAAMFKVCKDYRLGDAVTLAAMTGLRKGEILALEWSAVNIAEGVLVVRRTIEEVKGHFGVKEPKSKSSRRVVTLGAAAIDALKQRLKKAKDESMHPDEIPLVFPNTVGKLLRPKEFDRQTWYEIRTASGIPEAFKFHDLRHTQASLMIAASVPMKVI